MPFHSFCVYWSSSDTFQTKGEIKCEHHVIIFPNYHISKLPNIVNESTHFFLISFISGISGEPHPGSSYMLGQHTLSYSLDLKTLFLVKIS